MWAPHKAGKWCRWGRPSWSSTGRSPAFRPSQVWYAQARAQCHHWWRITPSSARDSLLLGMRATLCDVLYQAARPHGNDPGHQHRFRLRRSRALPHLAVRGPPARQEETRATRHRGSRREPGGSGDTRLLDGDFGVRTRVSQRGLGRRRSVRLHVSARERLCADAGSEGHRFGLCGSWLRSRRGRVRRGGNSGRQPQQHPSRPRHGLLRRGES
ncbi:unnamed protein product [Ectocarpus fasciculatus]